MKLEREIRCINNGTKIFIIFEVWEELKHFKWKTTLSSFRFIFYFIYLFGFLGPNLRHVEVARLEIE